MKKVTKLSINNSKPAASAESIQKGRYGTFSNRALLASVLQKGVRDHTHPNGANALARLPVAHEHAVMAILDGVSRIVNGDSNYAPTWQRIAAYAKLIEETLSE